MKVELENVKPMDIEKRSFEIITEELGDTPLIPGTELIVKRCIHTSADFDYAKKSLLLGGGSGDGHGRIRNGACIVTDTQMAKAGINKRALAATAVRLTASCPMRMWLPLQKRTGLPEPQPAWTRQQRWIKS